MILRDKILILVCLVIVIIYAELYQYTSDLYHDAPQEYDQEQGLQILVARDKIHSQVG